MTRRHDRTRRNFLKGSGLTLAGFGLMSLFPGSLVRHAMAAPFNGKRLLFIFERGGKDGINTLIPHGDPNYNTTTRPTLYIDPADSIDLGNGFAHLNPAGGDLMDLYNAGQLAAIHRVGYPSQSQSHFDSQRIWENGDWQNAHFFEGWLYRYIRENAISLGVELPAISAQSRAPLILQGDEKYVNVANPDSFDYLHAPPKRDKYQSAWTNLFQNPHGVEPYREILADTGMKMVNMLDEYRSWDQANWHPTDQEGKHLFPVSDETNPDETGGPNDKMFPTSAYRFFNSLKVCALALLEADDVNNLGTRVAGTELSGWDHHDGQGQLTGVHRDLLKQISYGIRSLSIVLSGSAHNEPRGYSSIWDDVVVVTMTEFGRTTEENGSLGTDHGDACMIFAAGGSINGGVYNCDGATWPAGSMYDVHGRYLSHLTDYRAIMWEILRDHMGASPATADTIFPGYTSEGLTELNLVGV